MMQMKFFSPLSNYTLSLIPKCEFYIFYLFLIKLNHSFKFYKKITKEKMKQKVQWF